MYYGYGVTLKDDGTNQCGETPFLALASGQKMVWMPILACILKCIGQQSDFPIHPSRFLLCSRTGEGGRCHCISVVTGSLRWSQKTGIRKCAVKRVIIGLSCQSPQQDRYSRYRTHLTHCAQKLIIAESACRLKPTLACCRLPATRKSECHSA